MHRLEQALIDQGFVPNREDNLYSSVQAGKVDKRYQLEECEVIWGLYEQGYPPTLISPRPFNMSRPVLDRYINDVKIDDFMKFIQDACN